MVWWSYVKAEFKNKERTINLSYVGPEQDTSKILMSMQEHLLNKYGDQHEYYVTYTKRDWMSKCVLWEEGKTIDDCMRIAQQKFKELHEISWEEFEKEWKKMDGNFPPDLEVSFLEG